MNVGVVHEAPRPTKSSRELLEAFRELGVNARYYRISKLTGFFGESGLRLRYGKYVVELDAVVVRSLGAITTTEQLLKRIGLLREMELKGIVVVNPSEAFLKARDKYMSLLLLSKHGVPVPDTIVTEDEQVVVEAVKEWGTVVIKPIIGSLGFGSVKVNDPDIAFRVARTLLSLGHPIYVQRHIEKPGRDIRVFTIGKSVLAAAYRIAAPGQWKTNVAQGANTEPAKITRELENLALKVVEILGLEYAGIDIAEAPNGEYYVLEANVAPLWEGLARATGVRPAKAIAEHVVSLVRR